MKKILSIILLVCTNNVFAQIAVPLDGIGVETQIAKNPNSVGKAIGWGIKKVFTTPIKISGKAVTACLVSKKVCAGIAAGTIGFAYLYEHPEVVEYYLKQHPDKYDDLQKYFEYRKANTVNADKFEQYEQAEENIGINARTIEEQLGLEQEHDFLNEVAKLEMIAQSIKNHEDMDKYVSSCSLDVAKNLFLSNNDFNKIINPILPKINDGNSTLFNVDKYKNLKALQNTVERDHIPSYKAMEIFFKDKNIDLSKMGKENKRYKNLNDNLTAINLPYNTHRAGRTFGIKNETFAKGDGFNSLFLEIGTIRDFATILIYERNNIQNYQTIIDAFTYVYTRNKLLCLYDIKG